MTTKLSPIQIAYTAALAQVETLRSEKAKMMEPHAHLLDDPDGLFQLEDPANRTHPQLDENQTNLDQYVDLEMAAESALHLTDAEELLRQAEDNLLAWAFETLKATHAGGKHAAELVIVFNAATARPYNFTVRRKAVAAAARYNPNL